MIRRLRLITGLILFSYISLHLIPLILGNHSLAIMEFVRPSLHGFWESWPGQILLYGAMAIHLILGFYAIYASILASYKPSCHRTPRQYRHCQVKFHLLR